LSGKGLFVSGSDFPLIAWRGYVEPLKKEEEKNRRRRRERRRKREGRNMYHLLCSAAPEIVLIRDTPTVCGKDRRPGSLLIMTTVLRISLFFRGFFHLFFGVFPVPSAVI
jgi:hypothetical protein